MITTATILRGKKSESRVANSILFKMSSLQQEQNMYNPGRETGKLTHTQEKRHSIEASSLWAQTVDLADKHFQVAIMNMFKD